MAQRASLLLFALLALPVAALAQGAPPPAPPPGPPEQTLPWWLWPAMFVPWVFLMVAGVLGTRWFDRHRNAPERPPE